MTPGTRLGPYEVLAPIGAGGMGQVWRARDSRLDRTVAIKVLPSDFARDAKLRARLEREAKAVSALSHPNICVLYDVGHEDGVDYLVMEYVDGGTLADRLARGPLPLDPVLRYGMEIAGALDRAHKKGIVHRDLKPENIMITKASAKLLDFGLAKTIELHEEGPLETKSVTEEQVVGTLPYMAPEQLEGGEIDHRVDVFALGCVLYEMIGRPEPLFQTRPGYIPPFVYDVTPDGQRFLVASAMSDAPPEPLTVVLNFDNELRAATSRK
jgi:serine/threonine protein kinase